MGLPGRSYKLFSIAENKPYTLETNPVERQYWILRRPSDRPPQLKSYVPHMVVKLHRTVKLSYQAFDA